MIIQLTNGVTNKIQLTNGVTNKKQLTNAFNERKWVAFVNCVARLVKPFPNRIIRLMNPKKILTNAYRLLLINSIFDRTIGYLCNTVSK